jgi:hypothetical protein
MSRPYSYPDVVTVHFITRQAQFAATDFQLTPVQQAALITQLRAWQADWLKDRTVTPRVVRRTSSRC